MKVSILALMTAFDGETEGWKMDGDKIAMQDGNPVWLNTDGTESVLKRDTISTLQGEAKTWRTRAEENLTKLKAFENIDPAKARDALEKIKKIDESKLIDSGEVDKLRATIKSEYDVSIKERDDAIGKMSKRINGMILDNAFSGSQFIRENVAIPTELFRGFFGQFFTVEDEKIAAIGKDGNRIMSKKNIGEFADFDEAISLLVENYPQKDAILKAPEHRGSGNAGGGGTNGGAGVGLLRRGQFDKLPPAEQAARAADVRSGKLKLVD